MVEGPLHLGPGFSLADDRDARAVRGEIRRPHVVGERLRGPSGEGSPDEGAFGDERDFPRHGGRDDRSAGEVEPARLAVHRARLVHLLPLTPVTAEDDLVLGEETSRRDGAATIAEAPEDRAHDRGTRPMPGAAEEGDREARPEEMPRSSGPSRLLLRDGRGASCENRLARPDPAIAAIPLGLDVVRDARLVTENRPQVTHAEIQG